LVSKRRPASSTPPESPPEPTPSEMMQAEVAKIKRFLGLDINRLAIGSDIEGEVNVNAWGKIWPTDYTTPGVNVIEFVNVSTSLGPSQAGSGSPAQVVGLTVTPQAGSDTQLNLTWTATTVPAEFNHYNVYRGPNGFTVGSAFEISEPTTNSYQNTGLTAGTTYYYRVSLTNDALLEGSPSSQVSGTTTGTAPIVPSLELHFDSNFTDTSPNGHVLNSSSNDINGFLSPGQFGSGAKKFAYPATPPPGDIIFYSDATTLRMDPTVGFSISVWVYPVSLFSGSRKTVVEKRDDANNIWTIQVEPTSLLVHFQVKEAGTDYKRVTATGLTVNAWNHIAATFNSASNTVAVYNAAVAGNSSSAATQWDSGTQTFFSLGSSSNDITTTRFLGYIDELRYYKGTVLTPTQITNLKNTNST